MLKTLRKFRKHLSKFLKYFEKIKIFDKNLETFYNIWRIKIKKLIEENFKKLEQNLMKKI